MKKRAVTALLLVLAISVSCEKNMNVSVVDIPGTSTSNKHYLTNRAPLAPSVLVKLPVGDIKPAGWLEEVLKRQADGLAGHLGEISAWLQKEDNAWLSPEGEGSWGWEEVPYWLKGFANTGYILDDQRIIDEAKIWIEGTLSSQREDGNFGPQKAWKSYILDEERASKERVIRVQDFWANMIMLYCLRSYYEYSEDQRVIDLMTEYFKYQLAVPDEEFLSEKHYWQRVRGGDNLDTVIWLYNLTGEEWLLELAEKVHRNTAPWDKRGHSLDDIGNWKQVREGMEWPGWYGDLIDWHNVNVAQGFREPAQYYQLSHDSAHLEASYENFRIVREHFGQVPGGMFGSDENCRPGYDDPRQGIETCGIVEQMNSDELMLRITGDIFWADHAEELAFNTYPAALMPDMKSLRYFTSPNMVLNDDSDHSPGIQNPGPFLMMNPFSSRCCQHNHTQGWPYLVENLWMATPDNGLAAVIYAASSVDAMVGDDSRVKLVSRTNYPFSSEIAITVSTASPADFPLWLRIPGWCNEAEVSVNGKMVDARPLAGKFVRIERTWQEGDEVLLNLPAGISIRKWEKNHNSVSVDYGPLTFSLLIEEEYLRQESDVTAIGDSKWQPGADTGKWPSYEIHPASNWNYALVLDNENPELSFKLFEREWPEDNYPFTPGSVPFIIRTNARQVPEWHIDRYGLAGELQDSPVITSAPEESVELIPMGAARLRISAFPVAAEGENGVRWESDY